MRKRSPIDLVDDLIGLVVDTASEGGVTPEVKTNFRVLLQDATAAVRPDADAGAVQRSRESAQRFHESVGRSLVSAALQNEPCGLGGPSEGNATRHCARRALTDLRVRLSV